jgi:DNA-binding response OmpR family regulator
MDHSLIPRILCIDDSCSLLHELESILKDHGIGVVKATHGIDALMQLKDWDGEFSAVIVAHELPGMTGASLLKLILGLSYRGRIILTTRGMKASELADYAEIPLSGVFHKPFETSMLTAMLFNDMSKSFP